MDNSRDMEKWLFRQSWLMYVQTLLNASSFILGKPVRKEEILLFEVVCILIQVTWFWAERLASTWYCSNVTTRKISFPKIALKCHLYLVVTVWHRGYSFSVVTEFFLNETPDIDTTSLLAGDKEAFWDKGTQFANAVSLVLLLLLLGFRLLRSSWFTKSGPLSFHADPFL